MLRELHPIQHLLHLAAAQFGRGDIEVFVLPVEIVAMCCSALITTGFPMPATGENACIVRA